LLRALWPFAEEHVGALRAPTVASVNTTARPDTMSRFPDNFVLPVPPPAAQWRAPVTAQQQNDVIEFSWAGETARHVGSVVHRWMQRIAEDGIEGWTSKRIEALRPRLARELERRGVPPAECSAAASRATLALVQTIEDTRGRWLLGAHADAKSEYRVRLAAGNTVYSYIMDRVFRDDAGVRWIVDYKTSGHEGADVDAFLDRERERYETQLARYAMALGEASTMLGLYFPLLSGWREWIDTSK
jgi:hypothetical protein